MTEYRSVNVDYSDIDSVLNDIIGDGRSFGDYVGSMMDGNVLSYDDISVESPYNTYKVNGLPPTPISNPSITSIRAAENPTDTEYMFFVANKDGNGHVFSKTYEEHLKNIE